MSFKTLLLIFLSILGISGVLYIIKEKSPFLTTNTINQVRSIKKELWNSMTTDVESWTDALGMPIDPKIKETVIVLNLLGFKTSQSCEGHIDWGNPYPWISFSAGDSEIKLLAQKADNILEKVAIERKKLTEKYPDTPISEINLDVEAPGLTLLYDQIRELGDQIKRLSRLKFIMLNDLINKFYKKHSEDYDRILFLSDSVVNEYWLISIGSCWQVARDEDARAKKLKEYQEEMQLFTEFLKDYYWSNFDQSHQKDFN